MGWYNASYGYGVNMERIVSFKENAFKNIVKKYNLYESLDLDQEEDPDNYECQEAIEEYEDSCGEKGIAVILSEIANDKGIDLTAITDCSGNQFLVILQNYPWNYSEKTKKMDAKDIDDLLRKLLSEITEDSLEIKTWEIEECFG